MKWTPLIAALVSLTALVLSAPASVLDITNNAIVLDFPPAGPNPQTTIRAEIISGRGKVGLGALWDGTSGITSSTAAADAIASPNSTSVAYAHNGTLPLGAYAEYRGTPADASSVLIGYTRTGDATLNGVVDNNDVTIVGANFAPGFSKPFWALGDFDYNGFVDSNDVTLLGVFYNPNAPPIPPPVQSGSLSAVPEPATVALAITALAALAVILARRRMASARCAS
jgi:hypothetical protein